MAPGPLLAPGSTWCEFIDRKGGQGRGSTRWVAPSACSSFKIQSKFREWRVEGGWTNTAARLGVSFCLTRCGSPGGYASNLSCHLPEPRRFLRRRAQELRKGMDTIRKQVERNRQTHRHLAHRSPALAFIPAI